MLYFTNHTNLTAHWWMYWDRQSWVINVAKCTKRSTLLKQFTSITSLKERKQIMAFCCIELVANFSMVSPVETFQFGRLGKAGGNTWWDYNCNNGCLHHVCMPFQSVIYEDRCLRNMFAGNKKGRPPMAMKLCVLCLHHNINPVLNLHKNPNHLRKTNTSLRCICYQLFMFPVLLNNFIKQRNLSDTCRGDLRSFLAK